MRLENVFQPIDIGPLTLKNRILMGPMGTGFADKDGHPTQQMIEYYAERAKGGPAMIIVEATSIDPIGGFGPYTLRIDDDKFIDGLSRLAKAIKNNGAYAAIQLNHAGRYALSRVIGTQPVAPSPIPSRYTGETPRELTGEEIEDIIEKFGDAARRAMEAGFDAVELMGATGYLLSQFISPITNKRVDKYGGDIHGRSTFALEVIRNIKKKTGVNFPISYKHSVSDYLPGGLTIEESKIFAKKVEEAGVHMFHAWSGWHESPIPMLTMDVKHGAFASLAEEMKKVIRIPVVAVGRINDLRIADQIIGEGKADLVALSRAHLSDPYIVKKSAEGKFNEVRVCIACCRCFDEIMMGMFLGERRGVKCAVNAEVGREWEKRVKPAEKPKKVLVIGGGPAGMEAARVAALRGHKVTLWEQSDKLGGNLHAASKAPYKDEILKFVDYLVNQLNMLGVEVKTSKHVDAEEVVKGSFDEVIVATGSKPLIPKIPGVDKKHVVTAVDVLMGRVNVGDNVVIAGGGMVGCETSEFLAEKGKKVTIVEMLSRIASDIGPTSRWVIVRRLRGNPNITIMTNTKLVEIIDEGAIVEREGKRESIKADNVILAVGMVANQELYNRLKDKGLSLHRIGDCIEARRILEAVHEGWEVACKI